MSSPEVVDLEGVASLGTLRGDWLEFAAAVEGSSYFQTPDWVLSWWDSFAARPRTHIATWRTPSGRLEALVALCRDHEALHRRLPFAVTVWTNAGSGAGAADHCGWLARAERGGDVAAWLSNAASDLPLVVRNADPAWPAGALPAGARTVDTTACPRVALPLSSEASGPSKDFVRQLRRFTRRLGNEGLRFDWLAPGEMDERVLGALFELHARSRAERGRGSFGAKQLPLHRRLVECAEAGRGPSAVVARRDEQILGVLYGFWWRDTFAAYQSGWDREYARNGLGNVLVLHALEFAAEHGAQTFDFLRGTEPYKYRFGARDRRDRTWLVPRGAGGALLVARHQLRRRRRREP